MSKDKRFVHVIEASNGEFMEFWVDEKGADSKRFKYSAYMNLNPLGWGKTPPTQSSSVKIVDKDYKLVNRLTEHTVVTLETLGITMDYELLDCEDN